jgi:replicative DNA helicase
MQLTDGVPRRTSLDYHINIVRKKALLRGIIHLSNGAIAEASDVAANPEECLSEFENSLLSMRAGYTNERAVTLKDRIRNTLEAIHKASMIRSVNSLATGSASRAG